jgi:phosphohistidine phosphatase
MQICFLRHGDADWPDWDKPDDERPLTRRGRKEMKRVAKFLKQLKFRPGAILSSPLPRARQTAEIAAKRLGLQVQIEPGLAHGFDLERLRHMSTNVDAERLIIVGHEPEFSAVIKELSGSRVKLAKAGIALMEADEDCGSGELSWLFPPTIAKAARK